VGLTSNRKRVVAPILFLLLLFIPFLGNTQDARKDAVDSAAARRRFPSSLGLKVSSQWLVDNEEGKRVGFSTLLPTGRVVVVLFLSVRDPVTRAYAERIHQMGEDYKDKPLFIIGLSVNRNETLQELDTMADLWDWNFLMVRDVKQEVVRGLKANYTSQVMLIDRAREVKYSGPIDDCWFDSRKVKNPMARRAIDALIRGAPLADPEPDTFMGGLIR